MNFQMEKETFSSVKLIVQSLFTYWKVLMFCFVLSLLVGIVFSMRKPTTFTATMTFVIEKQGGSSTLGTLASQFGIPLGQSNDALGGENLIEILKSKKVINQVLLDTSYQSDSTTLADAFIQNQNTSITLGSVKMNDLNVRSKDSILGIIYKEITKKLKIELTDNSKGLIIVNYTSYDERFTKIFLEDLVNKTIQFYVESKMKNQQSNIVKLENRVDSVSSEIKTTLLSSSLDANRNQFVVQNESRVPSVQKQYKLSMLNALYSELVKNLEMSKTLASREEPIITVIDVPQYPLADEKVNIVKILGFSIITTTLLLIFFYLKEIVIDVLSS
jgi:uncharacterized protein involved in exopolysaccharide biosynthesis